MIYRYLQAKAPRLSTQHLGQTNCLLPKHPDRDLVHQVERRNPAPALPTMML